MRKSKRSFSANIQSTRGGSGLLKNHPDATLSEVKGLFSRENAEILLPPRRDQNDKRKRLIYELLLFGLGLRLDLFQLPSHFLLERTLYVLESGRGFFEENFCFLGLALPCRNETKAIVGE